MLPKDRLIKLFNEAKENGAEYVYVIVRMKDFDGDELIINPKENIDAKLNYYNKAYDENLFLNVNKNIHIVAYGWSIELSDIDEILYYPEYPEFE